jgi:hypothetical protein
MQETTQAKEKMGLNKDKLTILSVGGSLGSRTLNNGWKENLENLKEKGYQLIWQTGKLDYKELAKNPGFQLIQLKEFIKDMETALFCSRCHCFQSRSYCHFRAGSCTETGFIGSFPFCSGRPSNQKRHESG